MYLQEMYNLQFLACCTLSVFSWLIMLSASVSLAADKAGRPGKASCVEDVDWLNVSVVEPVVKRAEDVVVEGKGGRRGNTCF